MADRPEPGETTFYAWASEFGIPTGTNWEMVSDADRSRYAAVEEVILKELCNTEDERNERQWEQTVRLEIAKATVVNTKTDVQINLTSLNSLAGWIISGEVGVKT